MNPFVLMALAVIGPGLTNAPATCVATCSAALGLDVERWLFFAEARHAVRVFHL